ncbi:hypothetical protein A0H76_2008 [Hepatospora eriocheir]|uniref:Uncharacterized protein n=1 Tax=Hepatospora eriocheir TaxID=1081669 RepID=A0A1X0QG33_9MICR|nr:hypothetical protein A0H76_2008 [Hepatospora eriocheir]
MEVKLINNKERIKRKEKLLIAVLGEENTNKTELIKALTKQDPKKETMMDTYTERIRNNNLEYKVVFCDIKNSNEQFEKSLIKVSDIIMLVYSTNSERSVEKIKIYSELIKSINSKSAIILIGNEENQLKDEIITNYSFIVSTPTNEGIKKLREFLTKYSYKQFHIKQEDSSCNSITSCWNWFLELVNLRNNFYR